LSGRSQNKSKKYTPTSKDQNNIFDSRKISLSLADQFQIQGKTNLSHDGLNPAHVPC